MKRFALLAIATLAGCVGDNPDTGSSSSSSGASTSSSGGSSSGGSSSGGSSSGSTTGGNPKRAFVTHDAWTGNLGGLTGADDKCTAAAKSANLGGTWMAWLSTKKDTGPAQRFTTKNADGYVRTDGATIAASWNELLESATTPLDHAVDHDEKGMPLDGEKLVWTNTAPGGGWQTDTTSCGEWLDDSQGEAIYGDASQQNQQWTLSADFRPCGTMRHLYCFEQ